MTVTIMYGKCDSKLNARERRRIKRENERKSSPAINKTDNVDKAIRFANEERCKPNGIKERRKGATKWYAESESGNYFHATQPRQLGEIPLDRVRYH
ncbi:TPA: hypothetical protein ACPE2N_000786 [Escherichia coli]